MSIIKFNQNFSILSLSLGFSNLIFIAWYLYLLFDLAAFLTSAKTLREISFLSFLY